MTLTTTNAYNKRQAKQLQLMKDAINERYIMVTQYYSANELDRGVMYVYDTISNTGIWRRNGEQVFKDFLARKNFVNAHNVNKAIQEIKCSNIDINHDIVFDYRDNIRVFRNKTICVHPLKIHEHSSDFYKTVQIDIDYDPSKDSKMILQLFRDWVGAKDHKLLLGFMAYCLISGYPLKKMLWIIGGYDSGKTTFASLMKTFVGEKNSSDLNLNTFQRDPRLLGGLNNKMINVTAELGNGFLEDANNIKMITGDDTIQVDQKYAIANIIFKNEAKVLAHGNTFPRLSYKIDDAFYNRLMVVSFDNTYDSKGIGDVPELVYAFSEDGKSEMLNESLAYLPTLMTKGFSELAGIEEKRELYMKISDSVGAFIDTHFSVTYDDYIDENTPFQDPSELYEEYKIYCKPFGVTPMKRKSFVSSIGKRDGIVYRQARRNGERKRWLFCLERLFK